MKKGVLVLLVVGVFLAVFAGVFGALQLNRVVETRQVSTRLNQPPVVLKNASLEGVADNDFRATAKKVLPSVVSIDTRVRGRMFGEVMDRPYSQGSGVVIDQSGYIVTNNHVVRVDMGFRGSRLADAVSVTLSDGRTAPAKIVGTDPRADLAVLKVELPNLVPIDLGDSSKLEVGEWVLAIGNPLGFKNTLSAGVVSSIGRQLPSQTNSVFIDGIQTDAAINQGNSGGALVNSAGQLVGINSSIASINGGNVGIGFAIPVNRMKTVVEDILKFGYAKYGILGVSLSPRSQLLAMADARAELRQYANASTDPPDHGVVVLDVQQGLPAAQAGIGRWDVITSINGKEVKEPTDFFAAVSPLRPGAKVTVKVWQSGAVKDVSLTLAEAKGEE
ncbi:MAG: trypsin-like peptidase domain-containing protein [Fimbriimonadaceae bacterium]|nr:trypsin-like peptidase domain-containing protein [Fimbriimonadaceae bacterium]QYK56231.1 MAG: trypsin-like peptidase domain-containing protein [Fimbriimonadaceae bacterium]